LDPFLPLRCVEIPLVFGNEADRLQENLLLRTGSATISVFMSRLFTGYVGSFNRKYKRNFAKQASVLRGTNVT
jgi:hypothetical protein